MERTWSPSSVRQAPSVDFAEIHGTMVLPTRERERRGREKGKEKKRGGRRRKTKKKKRKMGGGGGGGGAGRWKKLERGRKKRKRWERVKGDMFCQRFNVSLSFQVEMDAPRVFRPRPFNLRQSVSYLLTTGNRRYFALTTTRELRALEDRARSFWIPTRAVDEVVEAGLFWIVPRSVAGGHGFVRRCRTARGDLGISHVVCGRFPSKRRKHFADLLNEFAQFCVFLVKVL